MLEIMFCSPWLVTYSYLWGSLTSPLSV